MAAELSKGHQATRKLYESHWGAPPFQSTIQPDFHEQALGQALATLAELWDKVLTPTLIRSYIAPLSRLTPAQAITAFTRAHEELRFFPLPATLLEFASQAKQNREGVVDLVEIFGAFNKHGRELKPIGPKVLKSANDDGSFLPREKWEWIPEIPAPVFKPALERALMTVGRGDRDAGIHMLSCHPGLPWNRQRGQDEAPSASFQARDRAQIENEWCDAVDEAQAMLGGR